MKSGKPADELWGTFAVDDHLRPRAFVAEAILFDRLVIPLPPKGNVVEHLEWVRAGWQPDRLLEIRNRLGSLAVAVPWNEELRNAWKREYSTHRVDTALQANVGNAAALDVRNIKSMPADTDPKYVTREVIVKKLAGALDENADRELVEEIRRLDVDPAGDVEVVVGYGSLAKYRAAGTQPRAEAARSSATTPAALFIKWDFLVPEDSSLSDTHLLLKAVALSAKEEFRDARRRFHEWRRKLASKGVSVEQARAEMLRCLTVYNEITAKQRWRTRCMTALQVAATAAPLADLAWPGAGIVGGVTLGAVSLWADTAIPHYRVGDRESVAALVHDSREAFGWRPRL